MITLTNNGTFLKYLSLPGGPVGEVEVIAVPPTGTGPGEGPAVELEFETDEERARFDHAISVKGVRKWIETGELVVLEAEFVPPPAPELVQVGVTKRRKRFDDPPSDDE